MSFKKIIIFIIMSFSLFSLSQTEKDKVLKDFNSFKKNYSDRNAEETVKYFSKSSIELYDKMLKVALGKETLAEDAFLESFIVLSINSNFNASEIEKLNGKDVIVWSINEGLDSFENFNALPILDIYQKDGYSFVKLGYETDNIDLRLSYEEGLWKVDLPYILSLVGQAVKTMFVGGSSETYPTDYSYDDIYYGEDTQAPRNNRNNSVWIQ